MNDKAIVNFEYNSNIYELDIPISFSANEFIIDLNEAFNLNMNIDDIYNCYLILENPIAFLQGNKELSEFGIRNGSTIIYKGVRDGLSI